MAAYRFQVAQAADTTLPRDYIVNTVHMDNPDPTPDVTAICGDMADVFLSTWYGSLTEREVRVTAYEVGPPPQFPVAEVIRNVGLAPTSGTPREVALCLSFYSERNLPRQRGRLYLFAAGGLAGLTLRPAPAIRTKALDLAEGLAGLGGIDWDWGVYSPTDQQFRAVTHAWCDDAWDVIRSRGLDPTTRDERATGA